MPEKKLREPWVQIMVAAKAAKAAQETAPPDSTECDKDWRCGPDCPGSSDCKSKDHDAGPFTSATKAAVQSPRETGKVRNEPGATGTSG